MEKAKPIYRCRVCSSFTEEPYHCGTPAELFLEPSRRLKLSKLMTALLRHAGPKAGILVDKSGWASLSELLRVIRSKKGYSWVERDHLIAVALLDSKGRFELSRDMEKIRATYGHSIRVNLGYKPLSLDQLPSRLYHGTIAENLPRILEEGLKPMKRLAVHMTTSVEEAVETGLRHGNRVVVLVIDPKCLARRGISVYRAGKRVFLARWVPPSCVEKTIRVYKPYKREGEES